MKFKAVNQEGGWATIEYAATWRYGYDFMLDAAQVALTDFGMNVQRVARAEMPGGNFTELAGELPAYGGKLRECPAFREECAAIAVAGVSRVMDCPLQIIFYNQTNVIGLDIPIVQFPEDHPVRKAFDGHADGYEHTFDQYMSSVEIKAYCADTERRVRRELSGKTQE
ncbi:MAG: hypothetical protein NC398_06420 [Acetatifactor muris]|nr:hypothetical protein [Acetatifactor muris]MCM1526617.1 hypothetical protein [Bacteroides sp.]